MATQKQLRIRALKLKHKINKDILRLSIIVSKLDSRDELSDNIKDDLKNLHRRGI